MNPAQASVVLPPNLDAAKINTLPASAYYIPNFISAEEEQLILDKVRITPRQDEMP